MPKDMKSVNEMVDYARQLRLHAAGRRSIHVRLSLLEKHLRDEHYRRFVAVTLRPIITDFEGVMFALPTNDVVLISKDANIDHIDPLLHHIRRKFRDSALIQRLDPVQGISDDFVEWFDIEDDYAGFRAYIEALAKSITEGSPLPLAEKDQEPAQIKSPGMLEIKSRPPEKVPPPTRKVKMVPIKPPQREVGVRELDPEMTVALNKALAASDIEGLLRKQKVMAIVGSAPPQTVMVHKFVPTSVVFEKLLESQVQRQDRWLDGYLAELLASRVLFAAPNMQNANSIASSLRISCEAVCDADFDHFDKSLGKQPRSAIVLEFGVTDILTNFGAYLEANAKLDALGYRVMVGDVDPRALLWLDYNSFDADFVKLKLPEGEASSWLDGQTEGLLFHQINKIGVARVILDGCDSKKDIAVGQGLGITLFQGQAVAPMSN